MCSRVVIQSFTLPRRCDEDFGMFISARRRLSRWAGFAALRTGPLPKVSYGPTCRPVDPRSRIQIGTKRGRVELLHGSPKARPNFKFSPHAR